MVEEGMNQGPGMVSRGGVDHDPRFLIQDDDGIIFKKDLQRKVLWLQGRRRRR
jgi:hypothetical protein